MKNFRDKKPSFKGENKSWGVDRGQSYGSSRDKQLFKATCSECGKSCEVPFRPTGDKPVFCSDCFNKKRDASDTRGGARPEWNDRAPKRDFNDRHAPRPEYSAPRDPRAPYKPAPVNNDEIKKQLSDISFKLDKLIAVMEKMTQAPVEVAPTIVKKEVSAKSAPTPKAVVKKVAPKKKVVVKKKK
jgi:CxxC-x17-CxxC domain-containing protein